MNNKTNISILIIEILILATIVIEILYNVISLTNKSSENLQNIVEDKIQVDESVVICDITENEKSSNKNTIEQVTIEDEEKLEEDITEVEAFELEDEENISYDGDKAKSWNINLSEYQGLTYYSQIDNRWKNIAYTSTGNSSQTIGTSGCGPASAAMVVSSINGTITPLEMAELFVQNGYRSANNGTYWSAYRAVADEFDIGYTETSNFEEALELLENNNYVICSVGNGLFTTGGHYIVLVGIDRNTLKIYDSYLYDGKFNTSTRKGKVEVSGNTIYCTVDNFKKYANYKRFFCYQNISHTENSKYKAGDRVLIDIPIKIAWQGSTESYDNSLVDSNGYQFWIKNSVIINNHIYGLGTVCYDGGTIDIVQIFEHQFWCKEIYMSNIPVQIIQISNTVGQIRKLKQRSIIYSNSNLSGLKFNYKANTTITILENISEDIDKIKANVTGRVGYINKNNYSR